MAQRSAIGAVAQRLYAELATHDPVKNRWSANPRQWALEYYPVISALLQTRFMALPVDYPKPETEDKIYSDPTYYRVLGMAFTMYARRNMFSFTPVGAPGPLGIIMYEWLHSRPSTARLFLDATVRMMMCGTTRLNTGPTLVHLPAALAVVLSGDYRMRYAGNGQALLRNLPFGPAWMIYTTTEDFDRGMNWGALVPEGRPLPFAGGSLPTPMDIACYAKLDQPPGPGQERAAALAYLQYIADVHARGLRDPAVGDLSRVPDSDTWSGLFEEWQKCVVQLHALRAGTWYVPPATRVVYAKATEHLIDLYCDWRAGNDHFHMVRPAEPGLCGVLVGVHEDVTPAEIDSILTVAGAMCGPSFGMYVWADTAAVRAVTAILVRHVRPGTDPYERYPALFRQAMDKGTIPCARRQWAPIQRLRIDHLLGLPPPARAPAAGSSAVAAESAPKRVREGEMEWPRSADATILAADIARMALARPVSAYEKQWQFRRAEAGIPPRQPLRDPRYRRGVHTDLVAANWARPEVFERAVADFLRSEWATGVPRWMAAYPFQRTSDPEIIPGDQWDNAADGGDDDHGYSNSALRQGRMYTDVVQPLAHLHDAVVATNPAVFAGDLRWCAIVDWDSAQRILIDRIPAYPQNVELVLAQLARTILRSALRLRSDVPSTRKPGTKQTRGWVMYATADDPAKVIYTIAIGLSGFRYLSAAGVREAARLLDECREGEDPQDPDQVAALADARLGKLCLPALTRGNVRPGEEGWWTYAS